jgi:YegS/Rv2252/BmrU family lipid kinase
VSRRLALIANPAASAGRALDVLAEARAELERLGAEFRVVETTSADHARDEASRAAGDGETVAALGGDGLVGTLAGVLCGSDAALAIVPGGRGNDFARVLGIPFEASAAARLACEGSERLVDVAEVDGKSYVGIASCGFDSEVNRLANEAKVVRGNLVYLYATVRAISVWRHATFEVTVDGQPHTVTGYSVSVGNSKAFGGGMYAFPHAELDDGKLDVMLVSDRWSKLHYLRGVAKAFKGRHVTEPELRFLRGETIEIRSDRPFTVYADGDPIADLPVTVRVAKQVLRVVVPG